MLFYFFGFGPLEPQPSRSLVIYFVNLGFSNFDKSSIKGFVLVVSSVSDCIPWKWVSVSIFQIKYFLIVLIVFASLLEFTCSHLFHLLVKQP
jgi:hypothetical protein